MSVDDGRGPAIDLGGNIRRLRLARGYTQAELARRAGGANRAMVAAMEVGRIANPGVKTLYPLALALGCTFEDLLGVQPLASSTRVRAVRKADAAIAAAVVVGEQPHDRQPDDA